MSGNVFTLSGNILALSSNVLTLSDNILSLSGNVLFLSGNVLSLSDNILSLSGNIFALSGNVLSLSGNVLSLSGNVLSLSGKKASCLPVQARQKNNSLLQTFTHSLFHSFALSLKKWQASLGKREKQSTFACMNDLHLTLIQTPLHWQQPEANRAMLEEKIWQIQQPTDIIVLPEMFTTGFSMDASAWAEPMNLTTFKWLKQLSAQTGAVITGSYIVTENGEFFNRLVWFQPDGAFKHYDKRHLFRMANEHEHYTAGKERLTCEWKGWRVCPLVCYDLRFPVWSRNVNLDYDVLLYVANWPAPRAHAWSSLLVARAIENLAYAVGVNRVGKDGKGLEYAGDSAVVDFKGTYLAQCHSEEIIKNVTLSKAELTEYREKFPAYKDADAFTLTL